MVQINFTGKEILTKVVYYGPALCGKTTNLQILHRMTDPERKTKLFSINTDQDRTLFFDLLPLNLGRIHGYRIKLQVYTVPGQVQYASTRRAVLAGADAVVFVADSQQGKMKANTDSLHDLGVNLPYNNLDISQIPMVLQYNKRDLKDVYEVHEMEKALNQGAHKSFEAVAISGHGVMDTFVAISRVMINSVVEKYRLDRGRSGKVDFGERLARALEEFRQTDSEDTNPVDLRTLQLKYEPPRSQRTPDVGLADSTAQAVPMSNADLIERAVSANMELANLYIKLDETKKERDARIKQLEAVNRIGETVTSMLDIDRLLGSMGRILGEHAGDCVCIALVDGKPPELKPWESYRLKSDPIFLVRAEKGKSLAHLLAHQRKPSIVTTESNPDWFNLIKTRFPTIEGLISIPLISHRRLLGLINIITTESKRGFEESDLYFFEATAQFLATAIENARLYSMVSNLNRNLERRMEEIKQLNENLEEAVSGRTQELYFANQALQRANMELRLLDKTKDEFMTLISHEFRNPLTAMCKSLRETLRDPETHNSVDVAKMVLKKASDLKTTISRLIDLFNLEHQKIDFDLGPVNVRDTMRKALKPHTKEIKRKQIKILTRLDADLEIRADEDWMVQLFSGILHNAAKFNPSGGEIRIWADDTPSATSLYVRDLGPGLPDDRKNQVFNKFQILQGDGFVEDGLGLGLPMAKIIMDRHGGQIDLLDPPSVQDRPQPGLVVRLMFPKTTL